ncbi:beta-N-acetylhexosaminidase [Membranihabitans marinus]|uniref:beta-N-acetylhexosaminidase n=1 Tax=Membranihabitans marinus TaxID=1227546 RepID=UPI001F31DD97|nr:beta-N-acetylhexosaminidase [Membranihabitans marinus]
MRIKSWVSVLAMWMMVSLLYGQEVSVVPMPQSIKSLNSSFYFGNHITIQESDFDNGQISHYLQQEIHDRFGIYTKIVAAEGDVVFVYDEGFSSESYSLKIDENIQINGDDAGLFYGIQTLLQLMADAEEGSTKFQLPTLEIEDSPAFQWRGIMLDESRHFFGKEVVLELLRWMAFYKLNVFHWHLTDSPGWRIEIKKYPYLTLIGGIGDDHHPHQKAQFYTQEEIKEIVAYAQNLHIEVVPEIDMPGHATSVNKAYPVFSGGGSERFPEFTLHPIKDTVATFLTDVLKEVDALFPSQKIHIGGDEVHFGNHAWKTDSLVVDWMKANHTSSLVDVEHYFLNRMADSVSGLNNTLLGWDEVVNAGLPIDNTIIYWWRHDRLDALTNALDAGYPVVLCPRIPLYLDFDQDESHRFGRKWGGRFADLKTIYHFPEDTLYADTHSDQILGLQGNIWTERIANRHRLMYMTFPRIAAVAEAGWAKSDNKDFNLFFHRLEHHMPWYEEGEIYFYDVFDPESTPEPVMIEGR